MPAVTFPTDPTRLDYTSTPWVDGDGNSWLWVVAKTRWESVAASGGGVTDHGALTGLADDDHTQYALADGSRGSFAAPLGADDNYVTDAEKTKLSNTSGTNTGDETAARIATALNAGTQDNAAADTDKIAVTHPAGGWMLLSTLWTWIKAKIDAGMTIAGAQTFSGQVQLAAGQAATDAQSAMSRGLADARYGANRQFILGSDATITAGSYTNVTGATVELEANSEYAFQGFLHIEALAALSRIQCRLAYTGTLQTVQGSICAIQINGSAYPASAGALLTFSFADVSSVDRMMPFTGFIRTDTAGTLTITSYRVSGSGSPLIKAGSQMRLQKL